RHTENPCVDLYFWNQVSLSVEHLSPVWLHLLVPVDMDDFIHQTSDPLVKRRDQYLQCFCVDVACLTDK
ncbi:hypothetical protein, partial [Salmonella enterica]|uniref:hypothetical protein n=1 Tax=Salmonella enterica TaxID=28901 RepID=UPI001C37C5B5